MGYVAKVPNKAECFFFIQVKQQHLEGNTNFLSNELKVTDKKSAKDRVFFVSAREALATRVNSDKGLATPGLYPLEEKFKSFHMCRNRE